MFQYDVLISNGIHQYFSAYKMIIDITNEYVADDIVTI